MPEADEAERSRRQHQGTCAEQRRHSGVSIDTVSCYGDPVECSWIPVLEWIFRTDQVVFAQCFFLGSNGFSGKVFSSNTYRFIESYAC